MIVVLFIAHSCGWFLWNVLKNKWNLVEDCNSQGKQAMLDVANDFELASDGDTYWEDGKFKFAPPVYVQRYSAVKEKLQALGPFKKIVDLGCAELGFFHYLKHLEGLEELLLVDQDEELLKSRCHVLKPLLIDHLKPRETPLLVKLLQGNASMPDTNFFGTEAIVAIELIEHMFPPDLDELPFTLFGVIQPEVVIITTPNSDFNVLFQLEGFRHLDHKFEWTRQQFKDWVKNIEVRFPNYGPKLYGIGAGPEGSSQYGTCSQMVIFQKKQLTYESQPPLLKDKFYKVISEIQYPFHPKIELSLEDKVKFEAEKFIHYAIDCEEYSTEDQIEIPLHKIMRMASEHTDSLQFLQSVLESNKWDIEENKSGEKCVVLPLSGIAYSSSSSECLEPDDRFPDLTNYQLEQEENWSDQESFLPDSSKLENSIVNSDSSFNVDCRDKIEWVENRCEPGVGHKSVEYSKSGCGGSSVDTSTCGTVATVFNSSSEHVSSSQCVDLSRFNPSDCNVTDTSFSSVNNSDSCHVNSSISLYESLPLSHKQINESIVKGDTPFDVSTSLSGQESIDFQQKIENESLDKFDESLISSHSLSKKDTFPVKRALDLPLESIIVNVNGNFEVGHNLTQKHWDCNDSKCASKLKSLSLGLSDGGLATFSGTCSSRSGFPCNGKSSAHQLPSDVNCIDFDCSEKLDSVRNQSQTGINRCLSLQYIKEKEGTSKSNRFSLCCEKENINICDIFKDSLRTKSCGHSFDEVVDLIRADTTANFDDSCSQSKAGDSGYPNTSDRDMDMDLTPEQVDELVSENESSLDERDEEEDLNGDMGAAAPIQFIEHVENGDVANNNRDGEGNNLDQIEVGQPLHFNQLIQEQGNNQALDQAPPPLHNVDSDSENEDKFMSCGSVFPDMTLVPELDGSISDDLRTCLGWVETSTPCHQGASSWRAPDVCSIPSITTSSVSLVVHPSSDSSVTMYNTVLDSTFPPWLLSIEPDILADEEFGDLLAEPLHFSSQSIQQDTEWSQLIVPGDVLGGGEPQSHPNL